MAVPFASRYVLASVFRQPVLRFFSSEASMKCSMHAKFTRLQRRGLLKIEGQDSVKCLHGLVTNDIELFHQDEDWHAMYAMFLNSNGRILHDVIFYKNRSPDEEPSFLVECDASAVSDVMKHLKIHKLRAQVDVSSVTDIVPWVVFSSDKPFELKNIPNRDVYACVKDPRLRELGFRVLLPRGDVVSACFENLHEADEDAYEIHRAKLGVCEGVQEMPPGSALPLEFNLTYLNGVSFHKGCYIGQELTARTYHTGVTRKRVMPFTVQRSAENVNFQEGTSIVTSRGKKAGKVCAVHGPYGMGVLRLELVKGEDKMFMEDGSGNSVEVSPKIPGWWPKEGQ